MNYMFHKMHQFNKKLLFFIVFEVIIGITITVLSLSITQSVVSMVTSQTQEQEFILVTSGLILLLTLLKVILLKLNEQTSIHRQNMRVSELYDVIDHVTEIDYQQLETDDYKEAQEKAINCVNSDSSLFQIFPQNLSKFLTNSIQIILFGSLLSSLNIFFMVLISILLVAIIIYRYFQQKFINKTRKERSEYFSQLHYIDRISSNFSLAKDIRLFNVNPWFVDVFNKVVDKIRKLTFKRTMLNFGGQIVSGVFIVILQGAGYWVLIEQYLNQQISIGEVTFFIGAITTIATNSSEFVNLVFNLKDNVEDISNLRNFYNYPKLFNHSSKKEVPLEIESIEFKDMTFGYPKSEKKLFENFNLKIHKNEKIALVGLNGAGKTTLIKLLCNLYKPDSGHILINGQDNQSYNVTDYYQLFSVVFQDLFTLPFSIKEMIIQDSEYQEERFKKVLKQSNFIEVIEAFPNKENSNLVKEVYPDGVTLSGGQNQKLKMAQALYKDAPILILDEPTSALDPLAESEVYRQYYQNSLNKISLFITHRLATTQFCDRILYLENGQIMEDGSHQELLQNQGLYYDMYQKQAYYYQKGELQ